MDEKPHILVVDDDDRLRSLLKKFLQEQGFMVSEAASAEAARGLLGWFSFDVMVLDVMMPGETGIELLARDSRSLPPVLMLSAMGEPDDRINGLEHGADDYLVKPFEPKELILRLRAILRRTAQARESATLQFGDYTFELDSGQLKRGDETIALTSNESAMLKILAEQAGQPVSREALAKLMPGASNERTVDVQVTRLRKKIEENEGKPLHLQTVRGAGYVLFGKRGGR